MYGGTLAKRRGTHLNHGSKPMLKYALLTYSILSLLATLVCLLRFCWEDIQRFRHPERYLDNKFGYNFKNRVMYLVVLFCLPGLNVLLILMFTKNVFSRIQKTQ